MTATNLHDTGAALLEQARSHNAGRAAQTLERAGAGRFTQTLLAIPAGQRLAEHEAPNSASLLVVSGRARVRAGEEHQTLVAGDLLAIPPARHAVEAIQDSVLLLTVAAGAIG
jgi:quercetin dioxygenase-like cupin family protein